MSGWFHYEKRERIAVTDGIKSRSATFGKAWWSRQWIQALERLDMGTRLSRGRSYARSGQVIDYAVRAGKVTARVQGSRRKPYDVEIKLGALSSAAWEKALDVLAGRAEYSARLLNGEMPEDIDEVFKSAGAALLPRTLGDLSTSCSCPDWANPCKHVAALHYILGEALDGDPFLLMALRGRNRDDVLTALRARRGDASPSSDIGEPARENVDLAGFWHGASLEGFDAGLARPNVRASVLRRLGPPGAWATEEEMRAVFGPLLFAASEAALRDAMD